MVGHYDIRIDNKSFVLLAIAQAFYYNITIHLPRKQIDPAYYLKSEIVSCALVGYFVSSGHKSDFNAMNIQKYHLNIRLYVPCNRQSLTSQRDGGRADRRTRCRYFIDVQLNEGCRQSYLSALRLLCAVQCVGRHIVRIGTVGACPWLVLI